MSPFKTDQPKQKHLKSCSRCRKHKTKCNYIETAPNPCSSCAKRGLNCHLELVVPVKRSNIIKNLSNDIQILKNLVNDLIIKDQNLKNLCITKGLKVDGLIDVENFIDEVDEEEEVVLDNNEEHIDDNITSISPSNYKLFDICCYSSSEIASFFNTFTSHYLPTIPIFNPEIFQNPTFLLADNNLLFWSIVFLITKNLDIFNNFILKEILNFTSNYKSKSTTITPVYSIILLSYFPIITSADNFDSDDDLDTCFFQWLSISHKYIQLNPLDEHSPSDQNLWALIFILGNFYSLRLNLQWEQPLDFSLKQCKLSNTYIGNLLNISSLLSKLLNNFTFKTSNTNNNTMLINSLSNWKFNLLNLKNNNMSTSPHLNPMFDFVELLLNLFQSQSFINNNTDLLFNNISNFYNSIKDLNLSQSPIFIKFSLEFISIFLTKLSYSHHFLSTSNDQLIPTLTQLYSNLFNKLLTIINFNDTKILFNLLLDFDSNVKFTNSLTNILNIDSFQKNLFPGIINDLKISLQTFKSIPSDSITSLQDFFTNENINFNSYYNNFTSFKGNFDLVILYSNEILKLPAVEQQPSQPDSITTTTASSIDSVPTLDFSSPGLSPELFSDTSSHTHSRPVSQPVSQLHSPSHSLSLLDPISIHNEKIELNNIEIDLLNSMDSWI